MVGRIPQPPKVACRDLHTLCPSGLTNPPSTANFSPLAAKRTVRQRQAICSLTSRKLPPRNLSPGDWSMAERYLFRASPLLHSRFSQHYCNKFSKNVQSLPSRPTSRHRKTFNRTSKRGWLNSQLPTLNFFSIPHGKFFRTKANSRTPTSSATGCKRSSPSPTIQN